MSVNSATIIGHLGKDPEVRYLPNGDAVANFSVATTEKWKDKATGDRKESTEWHRISVFGKLAEICGEYLRKGSLVYISGSIKTRKWTDKDGIEKYTTEIHARDMKMLGGREEGQQPAQRPQQQARPAAKTAAQKPAAPAGWDDMDSGVPF